MGGLPRVAPESWVLGTSPWGRRGGDVISEAPRNLQDRICVYQGPLHNNGSMFAKLALAELRPYTSQRVELISSDRLHTVSRGGRAPILKEGVATGGLV